MTRILMLLLLLGTALGGETAGAESFRCGQWIASADMSVAELLQKCGAPTTKSVEVVDVYAASAAGGRIYVGKSTIETWTYDRGSQSFAMIVTVVDGKIKSMDRGD